MHIKAILFVEIDEQLARSEQALAVLDVAAHQKASHHGLSITGRQVTNNETGDAKIVVWDTESAS